MIAVAGVLLAAGVGYAGTASAEMKTPQDAGFPVLQSSFEAPLQTVPATPEAISIQDNEPEQYVFTSPGGGAWSAQLDYIETIDRPDLIGTRGKNGETGRPGFAVLQHSFRGEEGFQPYLGVGVGVADTRFAQSGHLEKDSLAVMGVVGGNLQFTDMVGGFMQYEHAVATGVVGGAEGESKSHGVSFGVKIRLN